MNLIDGWLPWALFTVSVLAVAAIAAFSIAALVIPGFQFFPPPARDSWQHRAFVILFRFFVYPLLALSVVTFTPGDGDSPILRLAIGGLLVVAGLGSAFVITLHMGWRNAFGESRGLITDGAFRYSRNPVYVATWIGLAGWGLIANSIIVTILLMLWALLYLIAPKFEEPWMEEQYGAEYRAYKKRTRRFL